MAEPFGGLPFPSTDPLMLEALARRAEQQRNPGRLTRMFGGSEDEAWTPGLTERLLAEQVGMPEGRKQELERALETDNLIERPAFSPVTRNKHGEIRVGMPKVADILPAVGRVMTGGRLAAPVSRGTLAQTMADNPAPVRNISPRVTNKVQVAGEQNVIERPPVTTGAPANERAFAEDLDDYFAPPPQAAKPLPKPEDMIGSVPPGTPEIPFKPESFGKLPETGRPTPFAKDYPGFTPDEIAADRGVPLTRTMEGQKIPPTATVIGRRTIGGPNVGVTDEADLLDLAKRITGRDVQFPAVERMPDRWGNYNVPSRQASVRADIPAEHRPGFIAHEGVGHPLDFQHRAGAGWFSKLMDRKQQSARTLYGKDPPEVVQWLDNYPSRNWISEGNEVTVQGRKLGPGPQKATPYVLPEGSPKNTAPEGYTGVTPRGRGYSDTQTSAGSQVGREQTAEAISAYVLQPEQFKKKFPDLAAAIRAHFNSDPDIAKEIIFNARIGRGRTASLMAEAQRRAKMADMPPPPMGHNNPPPEGKFPQFRDAYPRYGDFKMEIKTPYTKDKAVKAELEQIPQEQRLNDPRFYKSKVISEEGKALNKERDRIKADMAKNGYKPYFNVEDRYDVDPANYPAPPVDTLQIKPKTAAAQQRLSDKLIDNPEAMARLRQAYEVGKQFPNAKNWYAVGQLEDEYIKEYGDVKGRTLFKDRFAAPMAETTGGASPETNFAMGHFINYLKSKNQPMPAESYQTPVGVGGRYGVGGWVGAPYGEQNPKRLNFMYNFLGHKNRATMDEQMTGLLEPGKTVPPPGHYGAYEEAVHKLAKDLGVDPRELQEVAWAGAKHLSEGGEGGAYGGKPMMQSINESIERTARLTGRTREEVVRLGLVRGEIPMYSTVPPGQATGLLSEAERRRVDELIEGRLSDSERARVDELISGR